MPERSTVSLWKNMFQTKTKFQEAADRRGTLTAFTPRLIEAGIAKDLKEAVRMRLRAETTVKSQPWEAAVRVSGHPRLYSKTLSNKKCY